MLNKTNLLISLLIFSITLAPSNTSAGPFSDGSSRVSIALGNGQLLNEDYLIIGVGGGYYFADGLEAGLDLSFWTGGDPSIREIAPRLQYVFQQSPSLNPYIGIFYNRTYIDGAANSDAAGYRLGVYMPTGERAYFGIGVVYSKLQDCTENFFVDCEDTYSELTLMFSL